jgi:hypothetical protein
MCSLVEVLKHVLPPPSGTNSKPRKQTSKQEAGSANHGKSCSDIGWERRSEGTKRSKEKSKQMKAFKQPFCPATY